MIGPDEGKILPQNILLAQAAQAQLDFRRRQRQDDLMRERLIKEALVEGDLRTARKIARSRPNFCASARSATKTPAAARASSSPLLWPTTASGCRPSRVKTR